MRLKWVGGPLDGCESFSDIAPQFLWHGPDPVDPYRKVIVYGLYSTKEPGTYEYRFSQDLTDKANEIIAQQRNN